jgi:membrane protease YdiL (CAAX protease family)
VSEPPEVLEPNADPVGDEAPTEARDTTPWQGRDLLITVLGGGGLGLVLGTAIIVPLIDSISGAAQLAILSTLLYGSLCGFGWWFALKRRGATLADAGFRWVGIGPILLMLPTAFLLIIVTAILLTGTDELVGDVPTAQDQVLGSQDTLPLSDLIWLVLAGSVLAPVAEEFLFRGLLYRYLRARRTILFATLVSSLLFALSHFILILIPSYIVFGIIEALVAERYKSLYPAIALHALNNGALFAGLFVTLN